MSTLLVIGIVASAVGAISAPRLIARVLWLAATSVLMAVLLATIGAPILAVVEVSVGAGLVAVLFIFTIGIAGDEGVQQDPVVPMPVALTLVTTAVLVAIWLLAPANGWSHLEHVELGLADISNVLWQVRAADMLGQAVLIIVAALAVRTILGSGQAPPARTPAACPDRAQVGPVPAAIHAMPVCPTPPTDAVVAGSTGAQETVPSAAREEVRTP